MQATKQPQPRRRVRPVLLGLLWIWAVCIFLVLDLFLNVSEFDGIRPRAKIYRSMRFVAHRMVGEPYRENDLFALMYADGPTRPQARSPAPVLTDLEPVPAPRIRAVRGVLPDAESEAGQRLLARLDTVASQSEDPRKRAAAKRGIERFFGKQARDARETGRDAHKEIGT